MIDGLDDPRKQMLLAMGLGLLGNQSGNFGKDLGQAGLLGLNAYNTGKSRKAKLADEEQQREMRAMQMAQMKKEQEDYTYAQQIAPQFFNAGSPGVDQAGNEMGVPPSAPKHDLVGYGMALAPRNMKMAFPFIQAGMKQGPQYKEVGGRLVAISPDNKVTEAYAPPEKPKHQKGDTREVRSGRRIITQEYDGKEWKTAFTSDMDKPEGPDKGPAAPQGYRFTQAGNLEAIPGGPADTKAGEKAEAMQKRQAGALARADFVLGQTKKAINATGVTTAGPLGAVARNIPGTGGYDLNKTVDSIKANIGFAELQAMREASPTGGALGQVAVQELNMLQSVLGSLDTAQSPDQLLKSLYAVEKHYQNWKRAVQESKLEQTSGGFRVLGRE